MLYRLIVIIVCFSTAIYSMDNERISSSYFQPADQRMQLSITKILTSRTSKSIFRFGPSYELQNSYGFIYEKRINPITGFVEQRSFTTNDIAHFSFDNPHIIVDITLK